MGTVAPLALADYLKAHYEPECELISGELFQKPLGTLEHMEMERRLEHLLTPFEQQALGHVVWELSCRIGTDVRIPDLVFYRPGAKFESGMLIDPALLAVEIVSPSQRQSELFAKCEAYHAWGVPYCWVIDPIKKAAWDYHSDHIVVSQLETLTAGEIEITLIELFR